MIKAVVTAFAFAAGAVLATDPAAAGKSDDAWAACIWQRVPSSASNWLTMPVPKRDYGLSQVPPEYVLQFRLQAACYEQMTATGKQRPPSFNAKAVRKSLEKLKPAALIQDQVDPKAFRCTRYFLNDPKQERPAGFDWGFGPDTSKAQFFSVQYFFAAEGGGAVGLPNQGGLRKCAFIQSDGTFVDA